MTKFEEIKAALNKGAKVIVRFDTYRGPEDVDAFIANWESEADENTGTLKFAQTRILYPGVKYRTYFRAAH